MRYLLAFLLWFAASATASAESFNGVVIAVIDGDTVLLKPDHFQATSRAFLKIRLADIDAPEKDQPYGDVATQWLSARVLNRRVTVETVATDTYGRTVAQIWMGVAQINLELVQSGLAWNSTRYRRNPELKAAQHEARRDGRGLWQAAAPTPPWVWRRAHSQQPAQSGR